MITAPHRIGILVTVGPTMQTEDDYAQALVAGASNFRFHIGHRERDHVGDLRRLRNVASRQGVPTRALFDFPSSRPRTGKMEPRKLRVGDAVTFVDEQESAGTAVPLPDLASIAQWLSRGENLGFADGKIRLRVENAEPTRLDAVVLGNAASDQLLKSGMAVVLPGRATVYRLLTPPDLQLLGQCVAEDCWPDWIALSFVSSPEQIGSARALLAKEYPGREVYIMAKIESLVGLQSVAVIAEVADGLMVARGDLLADLPPEELPDAQAAIIRAAQSRGRVSVVATQLLECFAETGDYSRAELCDIASAVAQQPTALMLSKESCFSPRAIPCIDLLSRFISRTERIEAEPAERTPAWPLSLLRPAVRPYQIVAIEGPNGVGKSTLCRRLARNAGWLTRLGVPEAFMAHNLKRRMIFDADWRASVLYFLAGAIEINRELRDLPEGSVVLLDRSPWSTLAVQAATDPDRASWVIRAMELAAASLPMPDHIVVLEASFGECRHRIAAKSSVESAFDKDEKPYFEREQTFYRRLKRDSPSAALLDTTGATADRVLASASREIGRLLSRGSQ